MRSQDRSGRLRAAMRRAAQFIAGCGLAFALVLPAQAQFWSPFSYGPPRRPPAAVPQQQAPYNPFGGFFAPQPDRKEAPADYSHAPAPQPHKTDAAPTTPIVVVGDAMADWLASGLEDAYSEQPEIGVLRRHRTTSGLIRYDPRRDVDWAQTAREIIAADKPKLIIMMIGSNDHQAIRERAPTPPPPHAPSVPATGKPAPGQPATPPAEPAGLPTEDVPNPPGADAEQTPLPAPEPGRNGSTSAAGPFEFHTDQWEAAYIKRIDATIAALKSANVPVLWVGLPSQRGARAMADASYLNELYRARAEKAGIVFVDVWDGFVDEQGRFSPQGPDFEGQIRRLRSGDGVYFTKFGARKLAHYAEREIGRVLANRAILVSLPSSVEPGQSARPGGPSNRPTAGPVIPLTAAVMAAPEELLGGTRPAPRPVSSDPLATRVLTKGEAIGAPAGRADDFSWPRGSVATVKADPEPPAVAARPGATPAAKPGTVGTTPPTAAAAKPGTVAAATPQHPDADAQTADQPKPKKPAPPRPPAPVTPFSMIFR
jgi:hypothetical protein